MERDTQDPQGSPSRRDGHNDEYEAAELASYAHNESDRTRGRRLVNRQQKAPPTTALGKKWDRVRRAWRNQISLTVPHEASRDNLANERTFLAYLRTSLALSMMGITITQVLRLERTLVSVPRFTYFALNKPLGLLFQVAAIVLAVVGGHRFWRQQITMARGRIWVGGWEIFVIMAFFSLLMLGVFVLFIVADVMP